MLGGSGSINGMLFVRGNKKNYDDWASAGCKGWSFAEVLPSFKRMEDWEGGASELGHHPLLRGRGSCRMGIDERAVVDPALRVLGVDGLRVADASIMPSVTGGNTNAPAMMIGEHCAGLMPDPVSASAEG